MNSKTSVLGKMMDQKQVAEMLGVSVKTLEYWRWKRMGPRFIKLGRLARYLEADVLSFVQGLIDREVNSNK